MLTGGASARELYLTWANLPDFAAMNNIDFYFGDERCVQPTDPDSNFGLAQRTLFVNGVPKGCVVNRMPAESADNVLAAESYGRRLPATIDILLLSVGEDGHIASLFPHSDSLLETRRLVVTVQGPRPPFRRMTVTPIVIRRAATVFVLAPGVRSAIRAAALQEPADVAAMPVRLVLNAIWLPDNASLVNSRAD
jgi:6-phosphogluconolactonase